MSVRAVLFDIDGVLMDSREANIAWYRDFLAGQGYDGIAREDLERGHYYSLREALAHLTKAPDEEVMGLLERARGLEGYPYELVQLPEGLTEVLEALSTNHALGVVSSRIHEGIDQFFDFTGTRAYFSAVIGYEDSERHKPDPDPLVVACSRLGVRPEEAVYIGDVPTDLACALAAGVHFIGFGPMVPEAAFQTDSFREIEAMLRMLEE